MVAETAAGVAITHGTLVEHDRMTGKTALAALFNAWAETQRTSSMGTRKVIDRLTCINGVYEVRDKLTKGRGLNIVLRPGGADAGMDEDLFGGRSGSWATTSRYAGESKKGQEGTDIQALGGSRGEPATPATSTPAPREFGPGRCDRCGVSLGKTSRAAGRCFPCRSRGEAAA